MALRYSADAAERARRAAAAEALARAKADAEAPPTDESPEAIIEAGRRSRRFRAEHAADSPEARKILTDNRQAFERFLNAWPGPASALAEAKAAFIERFQYAEYLKTLVTPELIERLAGSADPNIARTFAGVLRGISSERAATIIKEQLIGLAARNPDEFDSLGEAIEKFEIIQNDPKYQEADEEALEIEKRYKITDETRAELLAIENEPISPQEKQERFANYVRKTKGIIGSIQRGAEQSLERIARAKESIEEDIDDSDAEIGTLQNRQRQLVSELGPLRIAADAAREDQDDSVHEELAVLEAEDARIFQALKRARRTRDTHISALNNVLSIEAIVEAVAARKKLKKEVQDLRLALPAMDEHLGKVEGHINDIGSALRAVVDADPEIKKGIQKAIVEQAQGQNRPAPPKAEVPRSVGELSERFKENRQTVEKIREGMIKEVVPSRNVLQFEFDRIVLQDQAQGLNTPRGRLKENFLREKIEKTRRAYAMRNNRDKRVMDNIGARRVALLVIEKIIRRRGVN